MVVLVRILLSRTFNSHHLVLLDDAFPASFWQKNIMMAEKRLLQDIETGVVGDSDTDEAKVKNNFIFNTPWIHHAVLYRIVLIIIFRVYV